VLDDVHEALSAKEKTAVLFDWVKFVGEPLAGMQESKYQGLESGLGQLHFHNAQNNKV
jgi:hypothetical protein